MKNRSKKRVSKQDLIEEAAQETTDALSRKRADGNGGLTEPQSHSSPKTTEEICDWIAELSESILEKPDLAFSNISDSGDDEEKHNPKKRRGRSKMQQLLVLAGYDQNNNSSQDSEYISRLAIMSLLAILKDILPAYRIRLPTPQELKAKISNETKKLWDYERALLQHYQQYLKLLEKTWERGNASASSFCSPSALATTAMLSLCELLKSAFHFNFRSNLLTLVVRNTNCSTSAVIREACCEAVKYVFVHDAQGEVSLEATRQVAKMIKDRNMKVHAEVLKTFVSLPLRVHVDEAQAAKLATQANSKKRKRDKELGDIESELKEGQATVDKIVLARCQSDALQAVTLTYFRILKHGDRKAMRELLPPALEGLAKFAHLINIETVMDLLAVFKELLKDVDALPLDAALMAIYTAFETLRGPGRELQIDQKEYIGPLFTQLPRLCSETHCRKHTDVVIQCLDAAFIRRREYSTIRVIAFLKQIFTVALHTPPSTSVPLLAMARQILQRYPVAHQLLENEEDALTCGQYNPDVKDPEESNPSTSGWELGMLKFHIHPAVSNQALSAASLKMLQMPAEAPERLRNVIMYDEEHLHIPFKRIKKKHPLHNSSKNQKKPNFRFITPHTRKSILLKYIPKTNKARRPFLIPSQPVVNEKNSPP